MIDPVPVSLLFRSGMSREDALRVYTESVNREDTLFTYLPSLPGKLEQMRSLLHDPITGDEANALNDVVYRRRRYTDMIAWLQDEPVSWDGYFVREEFRAEEHDRRVVEQWKREDEDRAKGIEPPLQGMAALWRDRLGPPDPEMIAELNAKVKAEHMQSATPCPNCGTPPEFLEWSQFSGRIYNGWQTHCRFCLRQVNEFIDIMGTPARRLKRPAALLRNGNDLPM